MKLAIVLSVLAGCSAPAKNKPTTPTEPPKPPEIVWSSEPQPWHVPHQVYSRAVAGDVAMLAGSYGWITKLDLRTGKVLKDRRVAPADVQLYDVEHLGNDKWIAVGSTSLSAKSTGQSEVVAFAFDGATLASTKIPLSNRPDKGFAPPSIAVTSEGVVIAGRGLPLAIYDPATWAVKTIIDPALGWRAVEARGPILLATNVGTHRFDVSTNGQRKLSIRPAWMSAAGDGVEVLTSYNVGKIVATLYVDDKPPVTLPDAVTAIAIDSSGKRLITATKTELRVHELPSGEIKKRTPLGDIKYIGKLTAAGSRVVFNSDGIERVFDLDSGKLNAIDDGPTRPTGIAVDLDGTVLVLSNAVTRLSNGKPMAREKLADTELEGVRGDETRRYVTSTNGRKTFQLRTFGSTTPSGSWDFSDSPDHTWMTRDGALIFDYENAGAKLLARTKGVNLVTLSRRGSESDVLAMDPDGDALISLDGRVAVLAPDGKTRSTLRAPACEKVYAWGAVEVGGTRAATYNQNAIAIWDRTTGKLIGAGEFGRIPGEVLFVPKREEVLVQLDENLHVWAPGKSMRTLALPGMYSVAVSKDGKRLAVAFHDGHVTVYDVAGVLATLVAGTQPKAVEIPEECGEKDPLAVEPEDTGDGDDTGTDDPDPCGG